MRFQFLLLVALVAFSRLKSQPLNAFDSTSPKMNAVGKGDSSSLLMAFKNGEIHGFFRYFFMATDNKEGLSDYFANALGGGVEYRTSNFYGFQVGIGGSFVFNAGSSDLTKPDSETQRMNRYEIGLFDITNPSKRNGLYRLEKLYVKYNYKNSFVTLGKTILKTPFINPQDGRMRPTLVDGIVLNINDIKKIKIEAGYLYHISPRSTTEWFSMGKSIGLYPSGVNPDGAKSGYSGNITSSGVVFMGISLAPVEQLRVNAWEMLVGNVFNTMMVETTYDYRLNSDEKISLGLQAVRQNAVHDGGNPDASKTYFPVGSHSQTFGGKIEFSKKSWKTSFNYNRITSAGRYLMPREWGFDPFYTFLPREKNEGLGDVKAYTLMVQNLMLQSRMKIQVGVGYYDLPDVKQYALNKYGLPSYTQCNVDVRYEFRKMLSGLQLELLYAHKWNSGNTYNNDQYEINKVNMNSWSFILNYNF